MNLTQLVLISQLPKQTGQVCFTCLLVGALVGLLVSLFVSQRYTRKHLHWPCSASVSLTQFHPLYILVTQISNPCLRRQHLFNYLLLSIVMQPLQLYCISAHKLHVRYVRSRVPNQTPGTATNSRPTHTTQRPFHLTFPLRSLPCNCHSHFGRVLFCIVYGDKMSPYNTQEVYK